MHIEFLLEEESAEIFIKIIMNRFFPLISFRCHTFQGKMDLLKKIPNRLKGYRFNQQDDLKIIILVDRDREDCFVLKKKLEDMAAVNGLHTRSKPKLDSTYTIINRIAINELESWYLGDWETLCTIFPRIPDQRNKIHYRDPDQNTWEDLLKILQKGGYYSTGLLKLELASRMGNKIDPSRNVSNSFKLFYKAINEISTEY